MNRRLPKNRRPKVPGAVFLEDYLIPLGITQREAAERLQISYPRMNEIVNGKRAVTPETSLRLARFTGTEPEYWLNLQQAVDLWDAMHSTEAAAIEQIRPGTEEMLAPVRAVRERVKDVYLTGREVNKAKSRGRAWEPH
jgi:antitoxin HigA-1